VKTKKTIHKLYLKEGSTAWLERIEGKWVLRLAQDDQDEVDELSSQIPDGEAVEDGLDPQ